MTQSQDNRQVIGAVEAEDDVHDERRLMMKCVIDFVSTCFSMVHSQEDKDIKRKAR